MGTESQRFPVRAPKGPITKPLKGASKSARTKASRVRAVAERINKNAAKARDKYRCRFPLCQCHRLGLATHSSHDRHKGSGGDSTGQRSLPAGLITFCVRRHLDGIVSRTKGTLRTVYLTERMNDGPVAFEVDVEAIETVMGVNIQARRHASAGTGFVEVARESAAQTLLPLESWQRSILERLASLDL